MTLLVLNAQEVQRCLDSTELVDALDCAFREVSSGQAQMPVRLTIPVQPAGGRHSVMPAYLPQSGALAAKIITGFADNPAKGLPFILGIVLLNDHLTGTPLAVMDGAMVTGLRTAAGSALSVRALANRDANVLAILGTGLQAETHLRAIAVVRDLSEVRVVGRTEDAARSFVKRLQGEFAFRMRSVAGAQEALEGATIVVTASTASDPIVNFDWFTSGAHICAIGSHAPNKRELDSATVAKADLFTVDTRAGALAEAGDIQVPIREGVFSPERIVELGEVLNGTKPGRTDPRQITVYKSVGMAAMDAAAARLAYDTAQRCGEGTPVAF